PYRHETPYRHSDRACAAGARPARAAARDRPEPGSGASGAQGRPVVEDALAGRAGKAERPLRAAILQGRGGARPERSQGAGLHDAAANGRQADALRAVRDAAELRVLHAGRPGEHGGGEEQGRGEVHLRAGRPHRQAFRPEGRPDGRVLPPHRRGSVQVVSSKGIPPVEQFHGTTILSVRRGASVALGGDGQVTLGQVVIKGGARKVRRLYQDRILAGFAGGTADAFTLFERFEGKLDKHQGNLMRAAVELAKDWRTDRILRRLEAMLAVADKERSLLITGAGDVLEPEHGILAIVSGGPYAQAAARALLENSALSPQEI